MVELENQLLEMKKNMELLKGEKKQIELEVNKGIEEMNNRQKEYKRVVIKIGSSSLTYEETGSINFAKLEHLVRVITDLRNRGIDVCLVSSGAIAVGREALGMKERPKDMATKQACAAVGQARLMLTYQKFFGEYNQQAGQILMTKNTIGINLPLPNIEISS